MPQKIHPWNTKNRPAVGRISCLAELGARPIQAEPVHNHEGLTRLLAWSNTLGGRLYEETDAFLHFRRPERPE